MGNIIERDASKEKHKGTINRRTAAHYGRTNERSVITSEIGTGKKN